jgi:hypothetical protein
VSIPAAAARCSVLSAAVDEPLAGSAPRARAWLVVEQPGPYGFDALTESHLPQAVRDSLGALPKTTGTTVLLARQVGRHADDHHEVRERRFWFAHTSPGGVRMRTGALGDGDLLRPDLSDVLTAAARGELPPWGARSTAPLLLVCTNARRDVCCATVGRPIAESLAADPAYAADVLEVSHLGGHRFAPTALLLPSGHAFGRLDADSARRVLDAAREQRLGALDHHRGRTALAAPAQVAEHEVRAVEGVDELDALDVLRVLDGKAVPVPLRWGDDEEQVEAQVRHVDGRSWQVALHKEVMAVPRPESCGKPALPPVMWRASPPEALNLWR